MSKADTFNDLKFAFNDFTFTVTYASVFTEYETFDRR